MWELTEDMEKIDDKVCKKCKYCTLVSNVIACEYILIVGKSRRCPEGYCNKFSSKKGRKKCDRGCVKRPVYKISQDGNNKVKFESLSAASEAGYSPSCIRSAIEKNRQYKEFFWEYCKNNI